MDNKLVAAAAVVIIAVVLAYFMMGWGVDGNPSPSSGAQSDEEWAGFFDRNNLWQNGSLNRSVSEPREIGPDIVFMRLRETIPAPEDSEALIKTSDAYVNTTSGEAIIAGYYMTTPDYQEKRWELFLQQLDPSSIGR